MNTCKSCSHWSPPSPGRGDHGTCERIRHVDRTSVAYTEDGDDWASRLKTKPEFGCNLFVTEESS